MASDTPLPPSAVLAPSDDLDSRRRQALERMSQSRSTLRARLLPAPREAQQASRGARSASRRLGALWRHWRRRLSDSPVLMLAANAADLWWQQHPLRPLAQTIGGELQAEVSPWVRRHPVAAVGAAAVAGAAIVVSRPWWSRSVSVHLRRLRSQAGRWAMFQLGQAPVQAALVGIITTLLARQTDVQPAPAAAAGGTAPSAG